MPRMLSFSRPKYSSAGATWYFKNTTCGTTGLGVGVAAALAAEAESATSDTTVKKRFTVRSYWKVATKR
jgi:hypothetical protein